MEPPPPLFRQSVNTRCNAVSVTGNHREVETSEQNVRNVCIRSREKCVIKAAIYVVVGMLCPHERRNTDRDAMAESSLHIKLKRQPAVKRRSEFAELLIRHTYDPTTVMPLRTGLS